MRSRARISVIIPTHNRPEYLRKALKSVVAQTYRPLEIIIVDDASQNPVKREGFNDLCQGISLAVFRNDTIKGAAASRNSGIKKSSGQLIAFLDDDDTWLPEKLSRQTQALMNTKSESMRAAFCQMIIENEYGQVHRSQFPSSTEAIRQSILFGDGYLPPPTLLVERAVFDTVGFFDEHMPAFEDRQWALRYLQHYDIILVDESLARICQHSDARLTTCSTTMLTGELAYTAFMKTYLNTTGASHKGKALGYRYSKLGNEYLLSGQTRKGLASFLNAIRYNPFEIRAWIGLILGLGGATFYRKIMASRMTRVRLAEKLCIFTVVPQ